MIGLGIGLGLILLGFGVFAVFSQPMSHNQEVKLHASKLTKQGKYAEAVRYAEEHGRSSGADYEELEVAIYDWSVRAQTGERLKRNEKAQHYWKHEIDYKAYSESTSGAVTRPINALGDKEIVARIRDLHVRVLGYAGCARALGQ